MLAVLDGGGEVCPGDNKGHAMDPPANGRPHPCEIYHDLVLLNDDGGRSIRSGTRPSGVRPPMEIALDDLPRGTLGGCQWVALDTRDGGRLTVPRGYRCSKQWKIRA